MEVYLLTAATQAHNSNFLELAINTALPYIIAVLEMMGIFIVAWSGIHSFWRYIQNIFFHKTLDIQFYLASGLATGLEFKMASEILKTVLVQDLSELIVLGAVILLRAILSVLIHFEMKTHKKEN